MDHMPWLLERAHDTGGDACGHALMATCPPEPFPELSGNIPFGYAHNHKPETTTTTTTQSSHRTWELSKADLATLLDLSKKLDLDGEITPVMAWGMILAHPRLGELRREDLEKLIDDLKGKVRCYGYGSHLITSFLSNRAMLTFSPQVRSRDGGVRGSRCAQRCVHGEARGVFGETGDGHGLLDGGTVST